MEQFKKPTEEQLIYKGGYRTNALVLELANSSMRWDAIYTLRDEHYEHSGNTYFSLRRLYLDTNDATGYKLAKNCFSSYEQLEQMKSNPKFVKKWETWTKELRAMQLSEQLCDLIQSAKDGDVSSAKFLVKESEKALKELEGAVRSVGGRPKNREDNPEADAKLDRDQYANDVARLIAFK